MVLTVPVNDMVKWEIVVFSPRWDGQELFKRKIVFVLLNKLYASTMNMANNLFVIFISCLLTLTLQFIEETSSKCVNQLLF